MIHLNKSKVKISKVKTSKIKMATTTIMHMSKGRNVEKWKWMEVEISLTLTLTPSPSTLISVSTFLFSTFYFSPKFRFTVFFSTLYCICNKPVARIFGYAGSQLRSMGPRWNLWKVILDPNDEFLSKHFCDRSLRKKYFFLSGPPPFFFAFSSIPFFWI